MFIVVCYDITDNGRRAVVASEIENFGARVQRSVFECHLSEGDFTELRMRLMLHIAAGKDSIRYYIFLRKGQKARHCGWSWRSDARLGLFYCLRVSGSRGDLLNCCLSATLSAIL